MARKDWEEQAKKAGRKLYQAPAKAKAKATRKAKADNAGDDSKEG